MSYEKFSSTGSIKQKISTGQGVFLYLHKKLYCVIPWYY